MKSFINPSSACEAVPGSPGGAVAAGAHAGAWPAGWHPGWAPAIGPLVGAALTVQPEPGAGCFDPALASLARRPEQPIGLSLRLPFCAVHCLCCDRDIRAAQPDAVLDDYVAGLVEEIHALARRLGDGREVLQLQLGGGSVNVLNESQLAQLVHALKQHWLLPADGELSVECDPRRTSENQLRLLRGLGLRELNFGVLDLDPAVQRAIGRLQSAALVDDACSMARACGIECIDLGLMVGLPMQTEASWRATLQTLVAIGPDRVTLARYHHRPDRAPTQCAIDVDALPDAATCRALIAMAGDLLCGVGYRWIGADKFVLDADPLALALDQGRLRRNLIGYTATPPVPLLGLGAGAIGEIDGSVFWNASALPVWRQAVRDGAMPVAHARPGSPYESRRRAAVEHLLCQLELPSALLQGGLEALYANLADQAAEGLVQVLEDRIVVTDAGRHDLLKLCAGLQAPGATAAWSTR